MSRRFFHGRVLWAGRPIWIPALIAGSFLLGVCAGNTAAGSIFIRQSEEIASYFSGFFLLLESKALSAPEISNTVATYLKYPLLAALFGTVGAGVFLLPLLSAYQGFALSFSITAFLYAGGTDSILPAIILFGFRCLFVLPCYFYLAEHAAASAAARIAQKDPARRAAFDKIHILRMALCIVLLLCGACAEYFWLEKILYFIS